MGFCTKSSRILYRFTNNSVLLIGAMVFLLFTGWNKNKFVEEQYPSQAPFIPDIQFYYDRDTLLDFASQLNVHMKTRFVKEHLSFDLLWPLVYTSFLILLLSRLFKGRFREGSLLYSLNLVPVLALTFDLLENISLSIVIYQFPRKTFLLEYLCGYLTMFKWLVIIFIILAIIPGTFLMLRDFIRGLARR